jgi:radical SAM protein with 4Fe4S-binding SPASM domain
MKRKGAASNSQINKIIREAAPKSASVCPFLYQEPFLEPRLVNILANIKQNNPNCATVVYSNMANVSEETIKQIVEFNLLDELHISFYGPTEELYAKYQPPLNRAQTVANIKKFREIRDKAGKSKPVMTLHVLNVPEILEASQGYADVIGYVDCNAVVQFDTFHGVIPDYAGDQTKVMGAPAKRTPCQRLWTGLNVHFDGSVVPCCLDFNDEHVLGNVNKESLQEIWSGERFQAFRKLHLEKRWNEIEMCRNCRVHEYQFSKDWTAWWQNKNQYKKE